MARSIRSKRGRKLRAFKRIRYGEKELARLKIMVSKAAEEELKSVPDVTSASDSISIVAEPTAMETDLPKENKLLFKPPKYPSWLSNFKIKKLAKGERKHKRKETRRLKKQKKMLYKNKKGKKK